MGMQRAGHQRFHMSIEEKKRVEQDITVVITQAQ